MKESVVNTVATARARLASLVGSARDDLDLLDRFDRYGADLLEPLDEVYGLDSIIEPLIALLAANHTQRDAELHDRDRRRVLEPDWFQKPTTMGYVCYTDLFAGNLRGMAGRIPYLEGLGVTYLHLMPILKPREGANDGGYAVADYRSLRSDLGTMAELRATASKLHASGISLTLDLVLNHVALEHEWAEKARAGDTAYRDYFYVFDSKEIPDQYERSLPEVFPDFAPGNFTWDDDLGAWVWTTFNSYQWDVNWSNPAVFCEYADIIGNLANHGVDCLRLDAIAFIWKRMGTICQNEPEVHAITQALRTFARILAPSLIFKAEAIVGPAQVGAYLGEGKRAGKVSDLAYHNSLMVQIWSAIASRDADLLERSLSRFGSLPTTTAWGVYLRCHDDIGWAIDDSDAAALGVSGHGHRMFLADYFTGVFPDPTREGSTSRLTPPRASDEPPAPPHRWPELNPHSRRPMRSTSTPRLPGTCAHIRWCSVLAASRSCIWVTKSAWSTTSRSSKIRRRRTTTAGFTDPRWIGIPRNAQPLNPRPRQRRPFRPHSVFAPGLTTSSRFASRSRACTHPSRRKSAREDRAAWHFSIANTPPVASFRSTTCPTSHDSSTPMNSAGFTEKCTTTSQATPLTSGRGFRSHRTRCVG